MKKIYWSIISAIIAAICSIVGVYIYDSIKNYSNIEVIRCDSQLSDRKILAKIITKNTGNAPFTNFDIRFRIRFHPPATISSTLLTVDLPGSFQAGTSPCILQNREEGFYPKSKQIKWLTEIYRCKNLNPEDSLVFEVEQEGSINATKKERWLEKVGLDVGLMINSPGKNFAASCSDEGQCLSSEGNFSRDDVIDLPKKK